MLKGLATGMLALGLAGAILAPCQAMEDSAPDKLMAYAQLYPEVFQSTIKPAAYKPTGNKGQVVNLLLESFNGNTNVEELSMVLRPGDTTTVTTLKPEAQIKQLAESRGLQWSEYQRITQSLASDPQQFRAFIAHLNRDQMQRVLREKSQDDPHFVRNIKQAEHQVIVQKLLATLMK